MVLVAACSAPQPGTVANPGQEQTRSTATPSGVPALTEPVPSARQGTPAASERVHFLPEEVDLPGRASAPVQPAQTVNGILAVPENVAHVGWWDGSAYAGDPFGSTVIAGHVDSATEGLGFFSRLLRIEVGDSVDLRSGEHLQRYRVSVVQTIAKQALAADSQAFGQTGPHRLVLITCTGNYRRDRGGYDSNLVVVATPIGLAR